MISLPHAIATIYRPARITEVRSWSFGAVSVIRNPTAGAWVDSKGSLDDEAIFGPSTDFQCACGKYSGQEHERMICDCCGVKITTSECRRDRFGHINLPFRVRHPLSDTPAWLESFPVLPAAFRESHAGTVLNPLYENLVRSLSPFNAMTVEDVLAAIVRSLLPIVVESTVWSLKEASVLAQGMALCLISDAGSSGLV